MIIKEENKFKKIKIILIIIQTKYVKKRCKKRSDIEQKQMQTN